MTKSPKDRPVTRKLQLENLEQRIALTAQAVTDIEPIEVESTAANVEITTMLNQANQDSGVQYVHENYGFDGSGQTIAVIDSGIAWDHYALGGGFGEGHHVVGGWDFAENDANPYDDGPAGYHGTHVSGIIGSLDSEHTGVASGADLVSLRVFDDYGQSQFSWIEQALTWVHENRNSFANPITTVNLSLGTAWNSDTVPEWAQLEDEFAQLKEDGIFISVAAGNGFQQYQTPGLSYPAASEHVVPVASHDANGQMSDFSQRNDRVLVAPGEDINSTVPDHLFMGQRTGQFMRGSGTSMAAPYVAGSSALLREAFEFMGDENVDQQQLYEHFQNTAQRFFDSDTNAWYDRIDMQAAIDAIVTDSHSDQWHQATDLGTLSDQASANGIIGKLDDVDAFTFEAAADGQVTLSFTQSHDLVTQFSLRNQNFEINGNEITFDVVGGQSYEFSMATEAGIGHYSVELTLEASSDGGDNVDATDLGVVNDSRFQTGAIQSEAWFRVTAQQDGLLTNTAQFNGGQNLTFEFYNAQGNQIGSANGTQSIRFDSQVSEGEQILIRIVGDADNVELRSTNLVGLEGQTLTVNGTDGSDTISFSDRDELELNVNGITYEFLDSEVDSIAIQTGEGYDRVSIQTGDGDDQITVGANSINLSNSNYELQASGFESSHLRNLGGGNDQVNILGTSGNDRLRSTPFWISISGQGYHNQVLGFTQVTVDGGQGLDQATLLGGSGDDTFTIDGDLVRVESGSVHLDVEGFESVDLHARGGNNHLEIVGTQADEQLTLSRKGASWNSLSIQADAVGFNSINADLGNGSDHFQFFGSDPNDQVSIDTDQVVIDSAGVQLTANRAESINLIGSGEGQLVFAGSEGSDHVVLGPNASSMQNTHLNVDASGFSEIIVNGGDGQDQIQFVGSEGSDRLYWRGQQTTLIAQTGTFRAYGFESIDTNLMGGNDIAIIISSAESETLEIQRAQTGWSGQSFAGTMRGVDRFYVTGDSTNDTVNMYGFAEQDSLSGNANVIQAYLNDQQYYLRDFSYLVAHTLEGQSSNESLDAVDYLFELHGDWQ